MPWTMGPRSLLVLPFWFIFISEMKETWGQKSLIPTTVKSPSVLTSAKTNICTFKDDNCFWKDTEDGDDMDWLRESSEAIPDHSSGTADGVYLMVTGKERSGKSFYAHLLSETQNPSDSDMCLKFWYLMRGNDDSFLRVLMYSSDSPDDKKKLWSLSGFQSASWQDASVSISKTLTQKPFVITIESRIGNEGFIGIDDTSLEQSSCGVKPSSAAPSPYDCDFEHDFCKWVKNAEGADTFQIKREYGLDHTKGKGYFAAKWQAPLGHFVKNNFLTLTSPMIVQGAYCLKFVYKNFGNGKFRVYTKQGDTVGEMLNSDKQMQKWTLVTVNTGAIDSKFQIIVNYTYTGYDFLAYFAIDDISMVQGKCAGIDLQGERFICPFDNQPEKTPMCGFVSKSSSDNEWVEASQEDEGTPQTLYDVTYGSSTGKYAFVKQSGSMVDEAATRLVSPMFINNGKAHCLTFHYYMNGLDINTLNVYQDIDSPKSSSDFQENLMSAASDTSGIVSRPGIVWSREAKTTSGWRFAKINLPSGTHYKVVFESVSPAKSKDVEFALDDIKVTDEACGDPVACEFTDSFCSWDLGPPDDRCSYFNIYGVNRFGSRGGYFYTRTQDCRITSEVVKVPSSPEGYCFSFWYKPEAYTGGNLNVDLVTNLTFDIPTDHDIWSISESYASSQEWNHGQARLPQELTTQDFKLAFQSQGRWDLDSTSIEEGLCENLPSIAAPGFFDCNFEDGFCDWTSGGGSGNFVWQRQKGSEMESPTGPREDHLRGQGFFAYITNHKNPAEPQTAAWLKASISTRDAACLQFFYYMHGTAVNQFNVKQYFPDNDEVKTVFSMQREVGPFWIMNTIELIQDYNVYEIIFEVVRGSNADGDIAIDDVFIHHGSCPRFKHIEMRNVSDASDFPWHYSNHYDQTKGPFDTDVLNYWYSTPTNKQPQGLVSRMAMNGINNGGNHGGLLCLSFSYAIKGHTNGVLNIYQARPGQDIKSLTPRFTTWGSTNGSFVQSEVVLALDTVGDYDLVFENVVPPNGTDTIAVADNVHFPYACESTDCTFTYGFCDWENGPKGDKTMDWVLNDGAMTDGSTRPKVDHTSETAAGYYIYVESSNAREGYTATLESPHLKKYSTSGCCFHFWYHVRGEDVGFLRVLVEEDDAATLTKSTKILWELKSNQEDAWKPGKVNIPQAVLKASNFKITIEAQVKGSNGDIALDDLYFQDKKCETFKND